MRLLPRPTCRGRFFWFEGRNEHNYRMKGLILGFIHNMISNVFIPSVGLGNIERIKEEALPECLW
ncbi:hypothetical protein C172_12218 [Paenibacillus sp. FSL H8-457]|nr:hypothetical protein C172_12218 [Paenibacillus sp. FSL H8-457]